MPEDQCHKPSFIVTFIREKYARLLVCGKFIRRHDPQHNGAQHNDTQHEGLICDIQHNDTLQNNSLSFS
jgi:hypothetical protein